MSPGNGSHFRFGPERDRFEAVWSPTAYDTMTVILASLPVHWRFFVKTKLFAAMREMAARGESADIGRAMATVRRDFPQMPSAAGQ
jgi:N-methylhydantoinase B